MGCVQGFRSPSGSVGLVFSAQGPLQTPDRRITASDERLYAYRTSDGLGRWTLRDLGDRVMRQFSLTGAGCTLDKEYLYRDGLLAAELVEGRHFSLDHLGSPRLVTNASGAQVAWHTYYPFGEEATTPTQNTERLKFTAHERDLFNPTSPADDLDYMHARHYSPLTMRFTSTDAAGGSSESPQSWNRYTYVEGNPLRRIDPDGQAGADVLQNVPLVLPALPGLGALGGTVVAGPSLVVGGAVAALGVGTGYAITKIPGWNEAMTFPAATEMLSNLILAASDAAKAGDSRSLSTEEMAKRVSEKAGGNRVSANTAGGVRIDIDLAGKPHFDKATGQRIATPHVAETQLHVGPNGKVNTGTTKTRPATKQDIRTADRLLDERSP